MGVGERLGLAADTRWRAFTGEQTRQEMLWQPRPSCFNALLWCWKHCWVLSRAAICG